MKKLITILLILISNILVAQNFYRDTVLEKQMFEQINIYRVENGLTPFTWNDNNTTALAWGEHLASQGWGLTHCMCQPGSEILADVPFVFDGDNLKLIQHTITSWDNSPLHKQQMVRPESERVFFAAIVFEGTRSSTSKQKIKRVIFVGQFLHSEQYYINKGWDETGGEFTNILDIVGEMSYLNK